MLLNSRVCRFVVSLKSDQFSSLSRGSSRALSFLHCTLWTGLRGSRDHGHLLTCSNLCATKKGSCRCLYTRLERSNEISSPRPISGPSRTKGWKPKQTWIVLSSFTLRACTHTMLKQGQHQLHFRDVKPKQILHQQRFPV